MYIVLLSGGSGRRLWPLSNDTLSKQFLKLLKNERGEYESMVQRVVRQINAAQPDAEIIISAGASQSDNLRRQLGAAETVPEPSRRDTFPAIVLAAAYLREQKRCGENETFIVCPIDVFAESEYFRLLTDVAALTEGGPSRKSHNIGLLGAVPTYPSEKYGYIKVESGNVTGFVEKPPLEDAAALISNGAVWNCGVFALRIGYVLERARKYADFESVEELLRQYGKLPEVSFDYEVVEKEASIGVVIYKGVWKDLGTWNTLTEEMSDSATGKNIIISDTCVNTHVLNMLNIPIIAHGLTDAVIVASYDGLLVSSKRGSSFIKPLAERINMRPMYGLFKWGNYRVLDYKRTNRVSSLIRRVRVDAGQEINYAPRADRSQTYVVISGKGIFTLNGTDSVVAPGSVVTAAPGARHSLLAATELEFIEVWLGGDELNEYV